MLPPAGHRRQAATDIAALQSDRGDAPKSDHARVFLRGAADFVDQSQVGHVQAEDQGDGKPLLVHRALRVARASPFARRLPAAGGGGRAGGNAACVGGATGASSQSSPLSVSKTYCPVVTRVLEG